MQEINTFIFQYLNNLSQYAPIQELVFLFADLPIFFVPLFLVGTWIYYTYKQKDASSKEALMFVFYGCVIGILFALIIQQFVHLERPETAITNAGKLLLDHIPDASFPSDHATVSFAFLTGLFLLGFRRTFWMSFPFFILMNISRVIAGVHWPFDIIAGIFIGIFSAYLAARVLPKIKFVKSCNSFIMQVLTYIKL